MLSQLHSDLDKFQVRSCRKLHIVTSQVEYKQIAEATLAKKLQLVMKQLHDYLLGTNFLLVNAASCN